MKQDDKPLKSGVRQVSISPVGIERKHVGRYEWAGGLIDPSSCVLDVGCGCGYGAEVLNVADYTGIDYSLAAIEYAREYYGDDGRFEVGDATEITGNYDCIVAFEVLEHINNHAKAIDSWCKALNPGGVLLVSIPLMGRKAATHPFHVKDWTGDELNEILEAAGFNVLETVSQMPDGELAGPERAAEAHTLIVRATKQEIQQ